MDQPRKSLWAHPDFLRLWLAQALSLTGHQFGALAFPLVAILVLDASAPQVGLLTGLSGLPWLIFGLFVGVGVDRVRRRPVLIISDLLRGVLLAWVPVAAILGVLTIEHLYVVAFAVGTLSVFFETAYQSYLPTLVGRADLVEGNSKLAATESVTNVAGPSLAGAAIQLISAPAALAVDACSYLASALSLRTIRQREPDPHPTHERPIQALIAGMGFLWRQTVIRAFALSNATFMLSFMTLQAVLLVYYTRSLGLSAAFIGLTYTAGNVGSLVGAFTARRVGRRFAPGPAIIGSSVLRAIGLAAIPATLALPPSAVAPTLVAGLLVHAFGWSLWGVHQGTMRQLLVPDPLRGRVNGSFLFIVRGATAIGGFIGAALAAGLGVTATIIVAAAVASLSTAWLIIPSVIRLADPAEPLDAT
jgi:MFS family permease